jgi:hypothetical protein
MFLDQKQLFLSREITVWGIILQINGDNLRSCLTTDSQVISVKPDTPVPV